MKSIVGYFKEKADLHSSKKEAKVTAAKIKAAIEQGSASNIENIVAYTPRKVLELVTTVDDGFLEAAFKNGQADVLDMLLNKLYDSDPNRFFQTDVREDVSSNETAWRSTYKTLLYSAMEQKNAVLALYLAQHQNLNVDQESYQKFNGAKTWQCSSITKARDAGMIQVVIALAERLAEKRRNQGKEYLEKMVAEAEGYDHEAQEWRKLNLPNGVYKLPALNSPDAFKL